MDVGVVEIALYGKALVAQGGEGEDGAGAAAEVEENGHGAP
jgi:hypothetical protein